MRGNQKEEKGKNLVVKAGDTVFVPQKVKFGVIEAFAMVWSSNKYSDRLQSGWGIFELSGLYCHWTLRNFR